MNQEVYLVGLSPARAWWLGHHSLSPLSTVHFHQQKYIPCSHIKLFQSTHKHFYTLKLSTSHRETKHSTSNSFIHHLHTNETIRLTLNLGVPFVQKTLISIEEQEEIHYCQSVL